MRKDEVRKCTIAARVSIAMASGASPAGFSSYVQLVVIVRFRIGGYTMGIAKTIGLESDARGWDAEDKNVCPDCVEDEYLQGLINAHCNATRCDYCGRVESHNIAAPVEVLMDSVSEALEEHFADPAVAGLPRDSGEWIGEDAITSTNDALNQLGLVCNPELFDDIANSFHNTAWYPCANGYWLDVHEHQELISAWDRFVDEVKHHRRYFFSIDSNMGRGSSAPEEKYNSIELLYRLGDVVQNLQLTRVLPAGTLFFRARKTKDSPFVTFADLGPPPPEKSRAGRMNPAGISYCYLAFERETALAETVVGPASATIATFSLRYDVVVLDLKTPCPIPSVFDRDQQGARQEATFLMRFGKQIAMRVSKDGREHVDYVPSQVVSEFVAEIFRATDGSRLAGMVYPSTIQANGSNLVLFPGVGNDLEWEEALELVNVEQTKTSLGERLRAFFRHPRPSADSED